jgi:hydroxymethylglutaryl-CoA lyase
MKNTMSEIYITECPRDAMQGIKDFIPTDEKIDYIQSLLSIGFDCLDFGSFVSPKAIPQLADTAQVLSSLNLNDTRTDLLVIIANTRGAVDASEKDKIKYLGYPLSVNNTFQKKNTGKSITDSLKVLRDISGIVYSNDKELVVYLSMAFGNPYGDKYSPEDISDMISRLSDLGISRIMLSDTVGKANNEDIFSLYKASTKQIHDSIRVGVHLHSDKPGSIEKISSAYNAGCNTFDGALLGIGGCPMADNTLVGNIPTESIISFMNDNNLSNPKIDIEEFNYSKTIADKIFSKYH